MVRLLGRTSDARIYFQDSLTIIDHGSTLTVGAGGTYYVATHKKSLIWGWCIPRRVATPAWVVATSGYQLGITESGSMSAGYTLDWWAIGYTT